MHPTLVASLLAAIFSGGAVPIVWIIGIVLIVAEWSPSSVAACLWALC